MKVELRTHKSVRYEGYICPWHGATYNDEICPQCGVKCYHEKITDEAPVRIATFTCDETSNALQEHEKFLNRTGECWERAIESSMTKDRDFIYLYFGTFDECGYTLEFDGYTGDNPLLDKLFKTLEYTDKYNQKSCHIQNCDNYKLIVNAEW